MAGKSNSSEQSAFQGGNWVVSLEQNTGNSRSVHRALDTGVRDFRTDRNEASLSLASRNSIKEEEADKSNSTSQMSATNPQQNTSNPGDQNQQQTQQSSSNRDKNSQTHQAQGPAQRDQNQNVSTRQTSQEFIGIIPPREMNTRPRPSHSDAEGTGTYRRMAVCQENDDATGQRTKMRVYMKRF